MSPPMGTAAACSLLLLLLSQLEWSGHGYPMAQLNCSAKQEWTCAGGNECIAWARRCDGTPHCEDKSDEVGCKMIAKCEKSHRKCDSGHCISFNFWCDGDFDCPDQSDESGCSQYTCAPDSHWQCGDAGHCIPNSWRCDGQEDCPGGSDERGCDVDAPCPQGEWRCSSTTERKCIPERWKCDGEQDCKDNSDEAGCNKHALKYCPEKQFLMCTFSRECILASWWCDNDEDCTDGSDEAGCDQDKSDEFCEKNNGWTCNKTRECIGGNLRCNGRPECIDGSDEYECDITSGNSNNQSRCDPNVMLQCKVNNIVTACVPLQRGCDGHVDCDEGDGGKGCSSHYSYNSITPSTTGLPSCENATQFTCKNGKCIQRDMQCDGQDDCHDGSDETGCDVLALCDVDTQWECPGNGNATTRCLDKHLRCDGVQDCLDGADELNCTPQDCFPSAQWRCSGRPMQWIPMEFRCDGRQDCRDGSDETDCHMLDTNRIW